MSKQHKNLSAKKEIDKQINVTLSKLLKEY